MEHEFTFSQKTEDFEVTIKCAEHATWMELTERFISFLHACGYVVQPEEIAAYIDDMYFSGVEKEFDDLQVDTLTVRTGDHAF